MLKDPDFKAWYKAQSLVPFYMPHKEYATFINDFADDQMVFFKKYGIIQ